MKDSNETIWRHPTLESGKVETFITVSPPTFIRLCFQHLIRNVPLTVRGEKTRIISLDKSKYSQWEQILQSSVRKMVRPYSRES